MYRIKILTKKVNQEKKYFYFMYISVNELKIYGFMNTI